jgi:bifunctional non-homologous end joining protein LigD
MAGGYSGQAGEEENRHFPAAAQSRAEDNARSKKKEHRAEVNSETSPRSSPRAASKSKSDSAASHRKPGLAISMAKQLKGSVNRPAPSKVTPMLALSIAQPFNRADWLYEIKWDGYRAISFIEDGRVRLASRNHNDFTGQYPELQALPNYVSARTAVLDGEVVALDQEGRASFSLMQQRTGIRKRGRRVAGRSDVPVIYYVFDLIYLEGYDLHRVPLEQRKQVLSQIVTPSEIIRYSDHFDDGRALFEVARQKGLEGIIAKRRESCYEERRTGEWLKIKITQTVDCVVGGYTDPEGARQHFGSIVLGLYNRKGQLLHVGQAGTGFNQASLKQIFEMLKERESEHSPFHGPVDAGNLHWVKPELVAEIKFSEWTHATSEGGLKLRAPVFLALREDKQPKECSFEDQATTQGP